MLLLSLLLLPLSVRVFLVKIFSFSCCILLVSSITIRCSWKEPILLPRSPERNLDRTRERELEIEPTFVGCCHILVPNNREPFFRCWPKGPRVCGDLNNCFSFVFVSFDETVVSLLLVFVDSYKSDKVWSMSTSPRAHRLSFISLGWLHLRHWLPWNEKVLS